MAKKKLDIAVLGETKASQVTNDEKGITSLIKKMQKLSVVVVNPARVRQYARACELLAKTDKLDAFNLVEPGKQVKPKLFEAKSETGRYLSALLVRRRQVEEIKHLEKDPDNFMK